MKAVADAGHEIGIHGYTHENPIAMTPRAGERGARQVHRPRHQALGQAADRLCRAVVGVLAASPTSCCSRSGIKYDHSLMHHDFQPYYVRVGDSWTKIDYSKKPQRVDGAAEARPRRPI